MNNKIIYSDDCSGFVRLRTYLPEAVLEIRYAADNNFIGERIDGYEAPEAWLSIEAAAALKQASDELAGKGYALKIFDAYRPQMAVDHFVRWAGDLTDIRKKAEYYPELQKKEIIPLGYVAEHSSHTRGSTADLTLISRQTGEELDMGGSFDYFGERSHFSYTGITQEQKNHRILLRDVMIRHGFAPLAEEWWHFTLCDEPYPDTYFTFPVRG